MTRRHDERWAIPKGNDEHVLRLEEEVLRLNQVERTLEANIDFLRGERDRLMAAGEAARIEIADLDEESDRLAGHYVEVREENDRLKAEGLEAVKEWAEEWARQDRQIDRLREENRSLVQTIRRVLRGTPA